MGLVQSVDRDVPEMDSLKALLHFETLASPSPGKTLRPVQSDSTRYVLGRNEKNIFDLRWMAGGSRLYRAGSSQIKDKDFDTPPYLGSFTKLLYAFPLMSNKVYTDINVPTSGYFLLTRSKSSGTATLCVPFMERRCSLHLGSGEETTGVGFKLLTMRRTMLEYQSLGRILRTGNTTIIYRYRLS